MLRSAYYSKRIRKILVSFKSAQAGLVAWHWEPWSSCEPGPGSYSVNVLSGAASLHACFCRLGHSHCLAWKVTFPGEQGVHRVVTGWPQGLAVKSTGFSNGKTKWEEMLWCIQTVRESSFPRQHPLLPLQKRKLKPELFISTPSKPIYENRKFTRFWNPLLLLHSYIVQACLLIV